MTLSENMIYYRAAHGISQKKLAALAGVSVQTICNVENGTQNPSKMTEAKIRLVINAKESQ